MNTITLFNNGFSQVNLAIKKSFLAIVFLLSFTERVETFDL